MARWCRVWPCTRRRREKIMRFTKIFGRTRTAKHGASTAPRASTAFKAKGLWATLTKSKRKLPSAAVRVVWTVPPEGSRSRRTVMKGTGVVPSQFVEMIPYVLTIVVLAGFIGLSRAPRALGIPYQKEK